jgi:hypothetical protein
MLLKRHRRSIDVVWVGAAALIPVLVLPPAGLRFSS